MASCAEHIQKAFAALLAQCKDRHSYLKAALTYCGNAIKDPAALEAMGPDARANLYFYPLKLACESKEEALVSIALNATQHLITHGAVSATVGYSAPDVPAPVKKKGLFGLGGGSSKEEDAAAVPTPKAADASGGGGAASASAEPPIPLVSLIVAAACLNGSSASEDIQVRVVRNLLMCVSYPNMGTHGKVLLSAINTTYNVFLISKNQSVQATAKAALSQMIGIVQQRAEAECEGHLSSGGAAYGGGASLNVSAAGTAIAAAVAAAAATAVDESEKSAAAEQEAPPMVPSAAGCEPTADAESEAPAAEGEAAVAADAEEGLTATTDADAPSAANAAVDEAPELTVDALAASPSPSISRATTTLLDDGANDDGTEFGSESERDCFIILRSLSKLSAKAIPEGEHARPESPEFRGKLQALNMIYHFIMTVGAGLKARRSFRFALRQYVARSLLESCMSPSIEIARVALNTMQRLACDYRSVLQRETVVFFYNILFPVLESPNSGFEHRFTALQIMESVLSDAQAVMDLFANYDCVVGGTNLITELVNRCSKASQTSHAAPNWITPKQDGDLRVQAVRTLTAMTAALTEWVHSLSPTTPHASAARRMAGLGTSTGDSIASPTTTTDDSADGGAGGAASSSTFSPAATASGAAAATSDDGSVNRMLLNKKSYEQITEAFNRKGAKAGIALALEHGILKDDSPAELAAFFLTKGFDKVRIGEYLAPNKPQPKEVLKAFINMFCFEGLEIDEAMRVFLGKFKIQGEAETVDRTMEQFAQRYCDQNPTAFSSAGTAYVLAFSIMMLNTDAHSVHVKDKMQLTDFHRTLRGIDDGKDLPEAFVDGVYHRITTREIKLDGDSSSSSSAAAKAAAAARDQKTDRIFLSLAAKKSDGYKRETDTLVKTSLAMLTTLGEEAESDPNAAPIGTHNGEFISADHPSIAKAFWDVAWTAVLPSLSFPMEESTNQALIDHCLDGFDKALALTCTFNDATQREAFLGSLSGFTHLTNTKEMGYKNVKSIVAMMRVASREGDALEGSWYDVLKCISSLDKLHILSEAIDRIAAGSSHGHQQGAGHHQQHPASGRSGSAGPSQAGGAGSGKDGATLRKAGAFEARNAEIVAAHFDQGELDRIFSRSADLSGHAVVYLIESLCRVSAEELAEASPRTYSLQKLVEVAELNIGRMRYVWSQMWVHLSRHFISAGCNRQQLVAMYVVDGLRQLSIKFLARDELGSLGFQRDFMKPFEVIAASTPHADIREFVIAALGQMVDAKGYNIMSGWHSVLTTLGKCSSASEQSVVVSAAEVLHRITLKKLYLLDTTDLLTDVVTAWSMLAGNAVDKNVALSSIRFIRLLGTVANKGIPRPDAAYYSATDDLFVGRKMTFISLERLDDLIASELATVDPASPNTFADFRTWLSVFAALSSLTSVPDHHVRLEAVLAFFKTISDHALVFTAEDWEMITGGTIMPIFENVFCDIGMLEHDRVSRTATTPAEEEAIRADRKHHIRLLESAFEAYTRFYMRYHRQLPHHLPCLLNLLLSCSARGDPQVTNAGQGKLQILLCSEEVDFTEAEWDSIAAAVTKSMVEEVQVLGVLESSLAANRVHEATSLVHALVRTLITVSASLQNSKMPPAVTNAWLRLFLQCHRCASKVLDSPPMAAALRKIVTGRIVLDLQREACRGLVKCFGKVPVAEQLEIEAWVSTIIRRFSALAPTAPEFAVIHEVVLFLLRFMCDMPDDAFRSLFLHNFGGLCALVNNTDPLIRRCLSAAFLRLGNVASLYTSVEADAGTMVLPDAPDLNTTAAAPSMPAAVAPASAAIASSSSLRASAERASSVGSAVAAAVAAEASAVGSAAVSRTHSSAPAAEEQTNAAVAGEAVVEEEPREEKEAESSQAEETVDEPAAAEESEPAAAAAEE